MKSIKNYLFLFLLIVILYITVYYIYHVLYKSEISFGLEPNLNAKVSEHFTDVNYQNYKNIIPNGDFANGKDVGGYTDQSGSNKIIEKANPSPSSKYVLQQDDTSDLTFYEIIQPVSANSTYVLMMWVCLENPISTTPDYGRLLRVRILTNMGTNELPVVSYKIDRETTLSSGEKWTLVRYQFSASNQVKQNMNIYINYASELIAKKIYYANLNLYKVLTDIPDFVFTNGLTSFISGFYTENGVISLRDLGTLGNNYVLKNRAYVDTTAGSINMYNNVATQTNGKMLFGTSPMFMINLLASIEQNTASGQEESETDDPIISIQSAGKTVISVNVSPKNVVSLRCNDITKISQAPLILSNKTLLSIGFNNDLHSLIFYQDAVPLLRIENCPTLYFEQSSFIINPTQYMKMKVYDCMTHNYVLLESEHKELRAYLMDATKRVPANKPTLFDYIIPKSWSGSATTGTSTDDDGSMKDDFYRSFQSTKQVYTNVKKESCEKKTEVKPSDCPTSYKKGDDYYIFIPKDSYYHNKLGYHGEKLYGNDKAKVRYIYKLNFPDCDLPVILTEDEGRKYSNTCPFIIEKNNPCNMVGCGNVDWNKKYVEDLGLNDKCKKAVSYYCRINHDLDPKCVAWKPENKNHRQSIHVRDYFESPDEYCDITRYKIEDHPDFKNYIRKDKIPCWGCDVK